MKSRFERDQIVIIKHEGREVLGRVVKVQPSRRFAYVVKLKGGTMVRRGWWQLWSRERPPGWGTTRRIR